MTNDLGSLDFAAEFDQRCTEVSDVVQTLLISGMDAANETKQ